jgi:LPXTG-site transpeptidase (sortase) family protein
MNDSNIQTIIEQIALLLASFVWTVVILAVISIFWVYEDVQARWDFIASAPAEALAQSLPPETEAQPGAVLTTPTITPWAGPGATVTPTVTQPPTPTATWVVQPPGMLPETLNADEPTPIPVVIETSDEVDLPGLEQPATAPVTEPPTPIPTLIAPNPDQNPVPTPTPLPPAEPAAQPVGDNTVPTRLVIESVGIDSVVIPVGWSVVEKDGHQYSIWQVADNAVGWHKTTARIGQPGNTVMAGHHNVKGEVFRDLVNVEVGDKVVVYTGDIPHEYRVELKTIVKEKGEPVEVRQKNAQWIAGTNDERLTFITCWPYTNNTHRVIVVAKPL